MFHYHIFLKLFYTICVIKTSKPPNLNEKVCCNSCDCGKDQKACLRNEECETEKELCLDGCCKKQPKQIFKKGVFIC